MAGAKLPKHALRALYEIKKARGFCDFAKRAQVNFRTVQKMAKGDYVDIGLVRRVEAALQQEKPSAAPLTPEVVETIICTGYGITRETLRNIGGEGRAPGGAPALAEARQVAYLFMKSHLGMSKTAIGKHFGHADHTNVVHGLNKIQGRLGVEQDLKTKVARIQTKIFAAA